MTLVMAWIRQTPSKDELIIAADSRLSFGARWDCCPKILPLSRNDSALAFCGDTFFAYPVLLQLANAVRNYGKAESRELDVNELRPHFLKIMDRMSSDVDCFPHGRHVIDSTDYQILFGGYSWRSKRFKAWALHYDSGANSFGFRSLSFRNKRTRGTKPLIVIGDHRLTAIGKLYRQLAAAHKLTVGPFDMEPLDILVEMINDPAYDEIAGPPQLVKIYQHANVLPINVLWPVQNPQYIAHFGRPLLSYESSRYACLDLRTKELLSPMEAIKRLPP